MKKIFNFSYSRYKVIISVAKLTGIDFARYSFSSGYTRYLSFLVKDSVKRNCVMRSNDDLREKDFALSVTSLKSNLFIEVGEEDEAYLYRDQFDKYQK